MKPVRVLIVDDSAVVRRVLGQMLACDPEIVIVGTAGNGLQALARIQELSPDLVTLDIEMPVMGGLETLVEIRKLHPYLPVIMFSTLTERGATATLDALARGASDYVTKPSGGDLEFSPERVGEELISKIKSLCSGARAAAAAGCDALPRLFPRAMPHRHGCHRHVHRRAEGTHRADSATPRRLPRAHRDCATHASAVYTPAG